MDGSAIIVFSFIFSSIIASCQGSAGDQDPIFKSCVQQCGRTGCIRSDCFPNCKSLVKNDSTASSSSEFQIPSLLSVWRVWDCASECEYQCMVQREAERGEEGQHPLQYKGKWPFKRVWRLQEPASVAFSILNLAMHLQGWLSFLDLIYNVLPQKSQGNKTTHYEYSGLWIIYGVLSMNSWFWSTIFHSRDVQITERMDYFSAVAVIGYTLLVAIIRTLNLRIEATRVMAASPIIAFVSTHIMYLNFYSFDYGLNMKICVAMGMIQLFVWTLWGGFTCHPSRFKLWFVVFSGATAMLLEIYDFPPIWGLLDAHSIWHAVTVPLTYIWWSFIKDDALFSSNQHTNIRKEVEGPKKVR